jgi:Ca-activated chloride channel homolog
VRYKPPQSPASRPLEVLVRDSGADFRTASENFRFAAAVAEWGMLLRDSDYKSAASVDQVLDAARGARGRDEDGLRAEFIRLVELSRSLRSSAKAD